jgi:hypothetical protein
MNIDEINSKLEKLHSKHFPDVSFTFYYPNLIQAEILFVGVNPAGNNFDFVTKTKFEIQKHEYDVKFTKIYAYYRKFEYLAKGLNSSWEHIDLFAIRETDQAKLKKLIKNSKDYVSQSLEIFFELINIVKPKIIVICNAYASEILRQHFPKNTEKDYFMKNGCFLINGHRFIFTSMLTGQRALDRGSLLLLEYFLNEVLQK